MSETEGVGQEGLLDLPVLPLRGVVVFPGVISPLTVGRRRSLSAVQTAMAKDQRLLVITQKNPDTEGECGPGDLYLVGTLCEVRQVLQMPDAALRVLVEGQRRVVVKEFPQVEPHLVARGYHPDEPVEESLQMEALTRTVLEQFERAAQLSETSRSQPSIPLEALQAAMNVRDPSRLADFVAAHLATRVESKQAMLETFPARRRLERLVELLIREIEILEAENDIQSKVKEEIGSSQREAWLREQLRVIEEELGQESGFSEDAEELQSKIEQAGMPEEARRKAEKELQRLKRTPSVSPEAGVIRNYLDWLVSLPWSKATEDSLDIKRALQILEEDHYGLSKVKERVLEFLAVRMLAGDAVRSPILCFVGPPGTGKTSIGRSIARAMGREFIRLSLGGVRDEAEIRGHRRTYVGALPGRVIQTIARVKSKNPVFMIDEVDKVGMDFRGDPSAALLEVLDPEQNHSFVDHYMEVAFDLSQVLFITTANTVDPIIPALHDRMEIIEFPGYIEEEKACIAEQFLIPKQLKANGLSTQDLTITRAALSRIIRQYTKEAGVRNLERKIGETCRKVARRKAEGKGSATRVDARNLHQYVGPPQFHYGAAEKRDEVGVATGLGWTEAGGDLLPIEVMLLPGKGELVLTGRLGEVMRESGQAALTYAKRLAERLGINGDRAEKTNVHVHAPSGAVFKEGPSAGITMATAIISATLGIPVRRDVAMTGEVTLRGKVLPVGGIKEKVLAAHRAGIRHIIIPAENEKDLEEIPPYARRELEFHCVENMDEVLEVALTQPVSAVAKERRRSSYVPPTPPPQPA